MISKINFFNGQQGEALKELVETLSKEGYIVYLAGGAVRDFLLGLPYKDLDIVTNASIEQIQKLFTKVIPVGIQFGIVRVIIHSFEFEIARFRSDGPYLDGRHPESVKFSSPKEDAERRDFTINSLFYDFKSEQILDYVNGQEDLRNQLIKTVGNPQKRFSEDYLRIMRALRFSCQLNFSIDPETEAVAEKMAPYLSKVSGERLCIEVSKALFAHPEKALKTFQKWKITQILFPHWTYNNPIMSGPFLSGYHDVGWILSNFLLFFQRPICNLSVEFVSNEKWKYGNTYLSIIKDLIRCFKLSKKDSQELKLVGTVYAWPLIWAKFRPGFRGLLSQSDDFQFICMAAQQLKAWDDAMIQEVLGWRSKNRILSTLTGEDVIIVSPEQRGLVLIESLYLQYEGVLQTRDQALKWLNEKLQKEEI